MQTVGRVWLLIIIGTVWGVLPEACKTIEEILHINGYNSTTHTVRTEDGYYVTMYRIHNKTVPDPAGRPPLIMWHGFTNSGDKFLANGSHSTALFMFNEGFDVWLPSVRGTRYSRRHDKLSPTDAAYWNFTFEDYGRYDTRVCVDYVYNKTERQVMYLGLSQGFMQLMVAFSFDPGFYRQRLRGIVGWAPITRIDFSAHAGLLLGARLGILQLGQLLGLKSLFEFNADSCAVSARVCDVASWWCRLRLIITGDWAPFYDNVAAELHSTDATSFKNILHLASNAVRGGFYRYPVSGHPPEPYNLSRVSGMDIALCTGESDLVSTAANARWLEQQLKGNNHIHFNKYYHYLGHQTFVVSRYHRQHLIDTAEFFKKLT